MIDQDLHDTISAHRSRFNLDERFLKPTLGQLQKLAILFGEAGIKDRDLRIAMLREWSGVPQIESSWHLTRHTVSEMIDLLVDETEALSYEGAFFLSRLAAEVEGKAIA